MDTFFKVVTNTNLKVIFEHNVQHNEIILEIVQLKTK